MGGTNSIGTANTQLRSAIFTKPFTNTSHRTEEDIYTGNTARSYLNELAEMGVLEKKQIILKKYSNHKTQITNKSQISIKKFDSMPF